MPALKDDTGVDDVCVPGLLSILGMRKEEDCIPEHIHFTFHHVPSMVHADTVVVVVVVVVESKLVV